MSRRASATVTPVASKGAPGSAAYADALHAVALSLLERRDLEGVLRDVLRRAAQLVDTPDAYLYMVNAQAGCLVVTAALGIFETVIGARLGRGAGLAGRAWETGEAQMVDDYEAWPGRSPGFEALGLRSVAAIPLHVAGEVVGVLGLAQRQPGRRFAAADLASLARFGQLASLAIHNARVDAALAEKLRQHEEAAAALKQSEELFRGAFDATAIGAAIVSREGRFLRVNGAYCRLLGFSSEELLSKTFREIGYPDEHERALNARLFADAIAGHSEGYTLDKRYIRKDGTVVWVSLSGSPLRGADGTVWGVLAMAQDISTSRIAQEQLQRLTGDLEQRIQQRTEQLQTAYDRLLEGEHRLRVIIDTVPHFIYAKDADGRFRLVNRAMARAYGQSVDSMSGRLDADFAASPEELARQRGDDFEVIRDRRPRLSRERLELPALGEARLLETTRIPFEVGGEAGVLGVAVDVTERQRGEDLRLAKEAAERSDQAKSAFLATMSHELRTPLTSIRGALALITNEIPADAYPDLEELVAVGVRNCDRLIRIINDLLDLQRVEAGQMSFELARVQANTIMAECVSSLEPFAKDRGCRLEVAPGDPGAAFRADPLRLAQVVTNLIGNAIKFSPPGGLVSLRWARAMGGLRVEVEDRGPGIADEFQPRVFERFVQADSSDTRRKGGSGLGLSICKTFVEGMGGSIGFTSSDAGTVFHFLLPEWTAPDAPPAS